MQSQKEDIVVIQKDQINSKMSHEEDQYIAESKEMDVDSKNSPCDNAINRKKMVMVDDKEDEAMPEVPCTSTNSIKSVEIAGSSNGSPISNDNDASPSLSSQSKVKRGQANINTDISVEKSESSSDDDSSKRLKLNENTSKRAEDATESSSHRTSKFYKLNCKVKKRNYRNRRSTADGTGDANDEDTEAEEGMMTIPPDIQGGSDPCVDMGESLHPETVDDAPSELAEDSEDTNTDDHSESGRQREEDISNEVTTTSEDESAEENAVIPRCLKKEKPKANWFIVPEILNRELGKNYLLPQRFYGSLHVVERLELMYKLNEHQGCVNALNFNPTGNLLASGSDDLAVVIWDWALGKKCHTFHSGHRSNLFQAKWLPLDLEYLMVTCARDGQVRLMDLRHGCASRRLAAHHGPTHKLAVHPEIPQVIISAGEDAKVLLIDIRKNKPTTLLTVKDGPSEVQLYSVHLNPANSNEFCIGGRTPMVKIYDRRKLSSPLRTYCPPHLASNRYEHVTCAVYNYNGTEVLASYNDEDVYLFDDHFLQTGDFTHRYQGHRNSATVKGVNFFGPKSEYVISGSDCGNIFIWDKHTEAIVQWMPGDEKGVVNCLEPHPYFPVLATSGLDYDVKIWVPSCEHPPTMQNLESCIKTNWRNRKQDNVNERNALVGQVLWILLRHRHHYQRVRSVNSSRRSRDRRNREEEQEREDASEDFNEDAEEEDSSNDDNSSSPNDSQSEDGIGGLQCPPS